MTRLINAILFSWATLAVARDAKQQPATYPQVNAFTSQGCFSKLPAGAESVKTKIKFVSSGFCAEACKDTNKFVAITSPDGCHCADTYPPESALVKDSQCNYPCSAYPMEACGGEDPAAYSVWNTGIEVAVDNDNGSSSKKTEATITISSITPPSTPLSSKLPTASDDSRTAEGTTAVSTPTKGTSAEGTTANSTNGAQGTPSATGTDIPSAAAPRLSSPVGKFVRMFKVFFN
ncbi:hypothetical protein ACHAPT_013393 [Fusarium lateritium]